MKTVEITILPDGTTTIKAKGFKGVGCASATKELEMVLAGNSPDNKSDKRDPEFYQSITGSQMNRN